MERDIYEVDASLGISNSETAVGQMLLFSSRPGLDIKVLYIEGLRRSDGTELGYRGLGAVATR